MFRKMTDEGKGDHWSLLVVGRRKREREELRKNNEGPHSEGVPHMAAVRVT